jgi:hypothetical protein
VDPCRALLCRLWGGGSGETEDTVDTCSVALYGAEWEEGGGGACVQWGRGLGAGSETMFRVLARGLHDGRRRAGWIVVTSGVYPWGSSSEEWVAVL